MYSFGKAFDYVFAPLLDDQEIAAIPSHTAKLLLYSSRPSRSQVIAEEGELATFTSTWAAGSPKAVFTVTAQTDPDPNSEAEPVPWYVGVLFKLNASASYDCVIREIEWQRVKGHGQPLSVLPADLIEQFALLPSYCSNEEMIDAISIQVDMLKVDLLSKGFEWAEIYRPDRLKRAVVFLSLGHLLSNESKRPDDQFDSLAKKFDSMADKFLKLIELELDQDKNGAKDSKARVRGFSVAVR